MRPSFVLLIIEQYCYIEYRTDDGFVQQFHSPIYNLILVRYNKAVLKHT